MCSEYNRTGGRLLAAVLAAELAQSQIEFAALGQAPNPLRAEELKIHLPEISSPKPVVSGPERGTWKQNQKKHHYKGKK